MAEIPYEDLPPFLQMFEDWEREKSNPALSWKAPRAPVVDLPSEMPPAAPPSARPVAQVRVIPPTAPKLPARRTVRMPDADPRRSSSQGALL
ncbi:MULTISPECIES: hypothetical protein [Methylobacterium]|uniref:hypothetical protein n=1 Tax=Methylobacterium TaxID=407 RepID=UPI002F2FE540